LKELKEKGISIPNLFESGYVNVMKNLDSKYQKDTNKFSESAKNLTNILTNLDSNGFLIYHNSAIRRLNDWVNENNLVMINDLLGYLSKEAFMYVSRLHLKQE
jgi:hypothetical protein